MGFFFARAKSISICIFFICVFVFFSYSAHTSGGTLWFVPIKLIIYVYSPWKQQKKAKEKCVYIHTLSRKHTLTWMTERASARIRIHTRNIFSWTRLIISLFLYVMIIILCSVILYQLFNGNSGYTAQYTLYIHTHTQTCVCDTNGGITVEMNF